MMIATFDGKRMHAVSCHGPMSWEGSPSDVEETAGQFFGRLAILTLAISSVFGGALGIAVLFLGH